MELTVGRQLQSGRYRIDRVLGSGGFGTTYTATQVLARRPTMETRTVVIKEYFPREIARRDGMTASLIISEPNQSAFDSGLRKFVREGTILLGVAHPNIIRVFELFEENDTAYLVMEHITGGDLTDALIDAGGRLDEARTRAIMGGIVSALEVLHRHEPPIFHLDIKPANIMLRPDGRPVLIDFGAARLDQAHVHTSLSLTLNYAPPELLSHKQPGPESDVYEMGVLLHLLLTGSAPPNAMARSNQGEEADWKPELPEPWASVILKALDLQRETRPTDIRAWWNPAASPDAHMRRRSTDHLPPGQFRRRHSDRPSTDQRRRSDQAPAPAPTSQRKIWVGMGIALAAIGGVSFMLLNPPKVSSASQPTSAASARTATVPSAPASAAATKDLTETLAWISEAKAITSKDESAILGAVDQGANVNAATAMGETALHLAVSYDRAALVGFLLTRNADTAVRNNQGYTPLHLAASHNNSRLVRQLLAAGASRDARDSAGQTPQTLATSLGQTEAADALRAAP